MVNIDNLRVWFQQAPYRVFWAAVFCTTSAIALTVQLIVLPYLLPGLHAGNGLLVGGDWVTFHEVASRLAEKINAQGWQAWTLRPTAELTAGPEGQSTAGIAAAIYAITVSKPYVLIPLNAALHATAAVTLMRIARYLTGDDFTAMCAALPFVLFPSAMTWYAQIHKDGFYFAGAFLCLYGWMLLARLPTWQSGWRTVLAGLAWIGAGVALMGLVRTYSFQVVQGVGFVFATGLSMLFIVRGVKKQLPWKTCTAAIAVLFLVPLLLRLAPVDTKLSYKVPEATSTTGLTVDSHGEALVRDHWRASGWLPNLIENKFLWLAVQRDGYILREPDMEQHQKAGSMIDRDVRLFSVSDFVVYLPRAAQIGLLAPFPIHWITPGASTAGSLMRQLAGVEMIGVYCALLFLPYAMWHWRGKVEMWLPVVFGTMLVLVYAFSTPNLGSLHRQRYGFLMLLVGVGLAGCLSALKLRASRQAD
ncbi:MAG: hypothetical protein Q7U07_07005 [Gammaproteobacteria bacterium]|nr:hypothetical protein [Gammaproteobacteria bacterium]